MCGRYTHLYEWKQLHRLLSLTSPEVPLSLRYNIAPTQAAPVVLREQDSKMTVLRFMRWGLIPSWSKVMPTGKPLILARADGVQSKPSFRTAFRHRHCIIPISGFYEWQDVDGGKSDQPYYVTPAGPSQDRKSDPWLLAGLWDSWQDPSLPKDAPVIESFSIITTESNEVMARVHHRMPVILDPPSAHRWMDIRAGAESLVDVLALLRPCPSEWVTTRPVSTFVNSPRHDSPQCIQDVGRQDFGSIFDQKG
ncbi:MAG TPA: SOS response-associated peptidase [Phycisphaerales bacterium]|nr:SOS response-associated peptidase [Phycisphaerales bacterium]